MKGIHFTLAVLIAFSCWLPLQAGAHEDHDEHEAKEQYEESEKREATPAQQDQATREESTLTLPDGVKAPLSDFPTLHPMVVHFPIVMLILAFIAQVFSFFVFRKELSWVTIALLAGGLLGAWLAGNVFHPHTEDLPAFEDRVLEEHERYAALTIWIALAGLVWKLLSHFLFNRKLFAEIIAVLVIAGAAYSVSTAGHLGAQLIHIHGIGAQGNYLESEDH